MSYDIQWSGRGWLSEDTFREVVEHAPLISIDFVVTNPVGEILLGWRVNRPASGSWFVPGGRVRKGETLEAAAQRLGRSELGQNIDVSSMRFLGVYQHFYTDSVFDSERSTHYVVLAYQLMLDLDLRTLPCQQHGDYIWLSPQSVANDQTVHDNTRAYLSALQT